MRINSRLPKTFAIYIEKDNINFGYLRYHSVNSSKDNISYIFTLEHKLKDASKYVNYNNVKKVAYDLNDKNTFNEVKIIDINLNKFYYVKKTTKTKK